MDLRVMVLAAGRGTRLAGAAGDLPKPLVQVGGRSLLQWNLEWLGGSGVREVWVNLHHRGDRIRSALSDSAAPAVRFSEEPELLGTAGGWRQAAALAGPPASRWLVVYGDNAMRFDLGALLAAHTPPAAATIALFDPDRHANTGIAGGWAVLGADGLVHEFVEGAGRVAGGLVNAGAYVLEPDVLELVGPGAPDFGRDVLPVLAERGRLRGHVLEAGGFCLGVDTPERLALAERMLELAEVMG